MSFPNKTAQYFYTTSYIVMSLGFPNFWIEDLKCPKILYKVYRSFSNFLNTLVPIFIVFELGAFVTQNHLTKKQETDLMIYGISHPMLWSFSLILWNHTDDIKKLFAHILMLKSFYNDEAVEEKMMKKATIHSAALALSCTLSVVLHTTSAFIQYIKSEGPFTTVVTTWPLVEDLSNAAHVARVLSTVIWWIFVSRVIATYIIVIVLVTSISYQFLNLHSYFYSMGQIFEDPNLTQRAKEDRYEAAFKLGVRLHCRTLQCFEQFRGICQAIFSAQVIFAIIMLVFLMTQMLKSERTMMNTAATAITGTAVLISTGFFFWNAGDITEEAIKLPTAMSFSGWHNCHGESSIRVRRLVIIAMTHAQRPVVIKGLGLMNLSYKTYLSLVKSSYSVFSVIY